MALQIWRLFVPKQAVGADLQYFDLFNASGSASRIHVSSVRPVVSGAVAVTGLLGVDYAFVRNISDPVVASKTTDGEVIPDNVREEWSSLIYKTCGFYSSFNGALTTWAAIAG